MFHQLPEHQELKAGERYGTVPDVRLHAADVQLEHAGPDDRPHAFAAKVGVHPGEQFGQRERLGQVVPRAEFEAVHLALHVGQAGQHHHHLGWPVA
ncbi:MAG TPA: hypothetical protein VF070_48565 [Streptosporangiaceae bacterium]